MDIGAFHSVQYKFEGKIYRLNFDFRISTFQKKERKSKKFDFHETLLRFLSQNPNKNLYLTHNAFGNNGFEFDNDNIFINIDEFQRFCFGLDPRIDRANAFFRQDVNIENITLVGATEEQILEWIKSLSNEERKDFLGKIDGGYSLIDMTDYQLLQEIRDRGIGMKSIGILIDGNYSKAEIEEVGEKIDLTRINDVLAFWEEHKKSPKEVSEWQPFFKENFWVISQIFASPLTFYDDEFYVGGRPQGRTKGGKWVDYVGTHKFSKSIALIEIKTPVASLVEKTEYDKRVGIYPIHNDLSGAISQVLDQKDKVIKNCLHDKSPEYEVFNPRSILIIGSETNDKLEGARSDCFERFKSSQKDIEIITYEELFDKIQTLKDLLTK